MKFKSKYILVFFLIIFILGCKNEDNEIENESVNEKKAVKLEINLSGSLQNPSFSPDGKRIVFTRFRNGYNKPPADLYIFNLETKELRTLVSDGYNNVNLPGTSWNKENNYVVFSSERETHDEIYYIDGSTSTGDEIRITNRNNFVAYEPTFSPNGKYIVFESHKLDEEDMGRIVKYSIDENSNYIYLTPENEDCRQPNWSPRGDKILYQSEENEKWDIWIMNIDGSKREKITNFEGNKTDAVFSFDGKEIIFSYENENTAFANIYRLKIGNSTPVRLTEYSGYDGAPSISPDGKTLIFERAESEPENTNGTSLWVLYL